MSRLAVPIVLTLLLVLSTAAGALPPDPSTYQPYSCALPQDITYNDATYGNIQGRVYRPIGGLCSNNTAPPADRPLVLILNGAGYTYFDYDVLARHLAYNGFVSVVVQSDEPNPVLSCNPAGGPTCIEDRARKGLAYLKLFQANWTWAGQVDFTDISVAGHSRGGEAAVEAAAIIRWEEAGLGNPGVRAVVSLAPSDLGSASGPRRLLGRESPAFLVLYGSRDEQVSGVAASDPAPLFLPHQTGFALYDRAGTEGSLEGFPISTDNQVEMTDGLQMGLPQRSENCS